MTWLIILGAWLVTAMALAWVLGRAIRMAEDKQLSQEAVTGVLDVCPHSGMQSERAPGTFDSIPRPR